MPNPRTDAKGYQRARELCKELTQAEQKLWGALRNKQLGVKFRRQHAIGPYITDFCCIKEKLIIEVDGSQHLDQSEYDADRTSYFESRGYHVLRFWNNQIMQDLQDAGVASFAKSFESLMDAIVRKQEELKTNV